ncbi:MAG: O-antigen ligase family protein [Planctomycetota bacterium]|jgi:hypothetical protein
MITFIAVLSILTIVICAALVPLKPKWVFYIFLTFMLFSQIFYAYIGTAGNLGLPRAWSPADFLVWLTLIAAFFVRPERKFPAGGIKKCLIILVLVTVFATILGFVRNFHDAFTYLRVAYFVAPMIFALRYFTNSSRVNGFLKFVIIVLLAMFAVQILIRFGIFTPPSAEIEFETQLGGERGAKSLIPLLYFILISIGTGRLLCKVGFGFVSVLILLVGISGIALTETRSMYVSLTALVMAMFIFIKGRVKGLVFYGLVSLAAVFIAGAIGFDFLARFRLDYGKGQLALPKLTGWRAMEYQTIVSSYKSEPGFILAGRGIAAFHETPSLDYPYVAYYHSEYLGWLDRCGLIGLVSLIILMFACSWRSFTLARSDIPVLRYYGVTCFLLMAALTVDGIFHPILSHSRGASFLVCFFVIMANWRSIYQNLYQESWVFEDNEYGGVTYVQSNAALDSQVNSEAESV